MRVRPGPDATVRLFRIRAGVLYRLFMEFVRHPRARRYVIRVRPDGSVRVTLPRWGSRRHAELFALQQRPWIERQKAQAEQHRSAGVVYTPEALRELRSRAARELPSQLHCLA